MAWFTAGEVDRAITTATRVALVGTSVATASTSFAMFEAWARSDVSAAAANAGYTLAGTTTNAALKRLGIAVWYAYAAGARKGIEIPDRIKTDLYLVEQLREGKYRIPGATPSAQDGVGGVKFSSTSSTSSNGRVQYFSRSKTRYSW